MRASEQGYDLVKQIEGIMDIIKSFCENPKYKISYPTFQRVFKNKMKLQEVLFSQALKLHEKERILNTINLICGKFLERNLCDLKRILNSLSFENLELFLDMLHILILANCKKIVLEIYDALIHRLRGNLDLLAHFADILIETGLIDKAREILEYLLNNNYNVVAILINLAIVNYMLGFPELAKRYLSLYQKLTRKESSLWVPIRIAMAEFSSSVIKNY